jgi:hypothetical protein
MDLLAGAVRVMLAAWATEIATGFAATKVQGPCPLVAVRLKLNPAAGQLSAVLVQVTPTVVDPDSPLTRTVVQHKH